VPAALEQACKTLLRRSVVVACLATAALPVLAQSQLYGTLKGTPMEVFDDEDRRLFREASDKALNEAAVDEVVRWDNPKTQSHGELTVLKTFDWKKSPCRTIRVANEARGRKATKQLQSLPRRREVEDGQPFGAEKWGLSRKLGRRSACDIPLAMGRRSRESYFWPIERLLRRNARCAARPQQTRPAAGAS
jgi:surface antigen